MLYDFFHMQRIELSEEEKIKVILMREQGASFGEISSIIHRPKSTIYSFYKKYLISHSLSLKRGRKSIQTQELRDNITTKLQEFPFMTLRASK